MSERGVPPATAHADIKHFYDNEYHAAASVGSRLPWHTRRVAGRLEPLAGKVVLDVACGAGAWLAELAARGASVAGVDISTRAVAVCRERLPKADVRESVAESLPFETASFDLVSCLGSLEHFLDQPAALAEMRRVARPGAAVLILVPNAGFLTRRLGLYAGTEQTAARETVRTLGEWESMIAAAGLRVRHRWRDLHVLGRAWICRGPWWRWPVRALQAFALSVWPVAWQYQVYFDCEVLPSQ